MKPITIAVGKKKDLRERTEALCQSLDLEFLHFNTHFELSGHLSAVSKARFVIQSIPDGFVDANTASIIKSIKRATPSANLIAVPEKRIKLDMAAFIKKSGAELVLADDEFRSTTKIDFIISQTLNTDLIPIKASELVQGTEIPFTVLHLLTLNQRVIPVLTENQFLSAERFKKMLEIGEFYISGKDVNAFARYVDKNQDHSSLGHEIRCRAKYMNLVYTFKQLVVILTDESEAGSFQQGKELHDQLRAQAADLINHLSGLKDVWSVVNNAAFADKTAVDRAPAIAAAAGLLSLQCGIGNAEDVLIAALVGDIGLLDLSPKAALSYRLNKLDFEGENKQIFENHPILSLNRCLSRRLPISDQLKQIISMTHERVDQKGFPLRPVAAKIPMEAMCIQFCQIVDTAMKIELGKARFNLSEVRRSVVAREKMDGKIFTPEFLNKIEKSL